ncbi:unnamed protein product, partial [Brassica oleracea var. botrytis]
GWPKRTAVNPNVPHPLASSFHQGPEKTKERERVRERRVADRRNGDPATEKLQ